MSEHELKIALSRLSGLKSNFPKGNDADADLVSELHSIISDLEAATGVELGKFRIPDAWFKPQLFSQDIEAGENTYTPESYCVYEKFMMRVDALLSYFTLQLAQNKESVLGFSIAPNE